MYLTLSTFSDLFYVTMKTPLIGRKEEQAILHTALQSYEAEMVAVFGRRRVGKTFLVQTVYQDHLVFEVTGIQNGTRGKQLKYFTEQLEAFVQPAFPIKMPDDWQEAFKLLRDYLKDRIGQSTSKLVVFFDEVPWLAGKKSGFLEAFGYFWNSWASRQPLVVVICGSAASWMISKVIKDRGGLHNRITRRVFLEPFTLAETEAYLQSRNVLLDRYQTVQLYMAMGGVPHYLKEIMPGDSTVQSIDKVCFSKKGLLSNEFDQLYSSLFAHADNHVAVVRALAQSRQGMTRSQLSEFGKLSNGGGLTKVLEELTQSGFVAEYFPFGKKKKEKLYRLIDEYSLFYLQFIEQNRYQGSNPWHHLSQTPAYKTWAGYAFESLCLKHLEQIKQALGISGIFVQASSYYKKGTAREEGAQIDLVLDRNDHTINLFEIKFYNQPFAMTKEYADQLRHKMWVFQGNTKTKKQVNWVFVTTFGMTPNQHSIGLVVRSLSKDDLF